jgi:mutator protein MutT
MITVVAALIEKDGKYLIAKRAFGNEQVIGKWEFPGGKLEPNETEEGAIEREIKEEFEMDVKAIRYLTHNICKYPNKTIDLRLYECKYIKGDFHLHDHTEYKYVSKEEITNYDLCPADIPLAMYVKKM